MDRKISLNGALAYRDGAEMDDNPFNKARERVRWDCWRRQFTDEQNRRVGKI